VLLLVFGAWGTGPSPDAPPGSASGVVLVVPGVPGGRRVGGGRTREQCVRKRVAVVSQSRTPATKNTTILILYTYIYFIILGNL
jgi:hypothetical protein